MGGMVINMKYYVVSDVHGHYTELVEALERAGFDRENEQHILLSCGDLFDRGEENRQVYELIKGLPRKILIKGNHEDILCRVLKRGCITQTDRRNGTDITVAQMLGHGAVDESGHFDTVACAAQIEEIVAFVDSMRDYYETRRYIFVHGWLPITVEGRRPLIRPSWRDNPASEWEEARWLEWQQLYGTGAVPEGKTVVCGHRPARLGHMFDDTREPDCSEPFCGEGMIAIDAGTVRSGRVNVLVVEDD